MLDKDLKNLTVGASFELVIQSTAFGGEGVGRFNECVIFVPDVIPGEKVKVELVELKRNFGRAKLLEVLQADAGREKPPCKVYGQCGGCQYQHMTYPTELREKEKQLRDVLKRLGGLSDLDCIQPIIPSPNPYGYRNSIRLRKVRNDEGWTGAFVSRDNKSLVPVSECPIASPKINEMLTDLPEIMKDFEQPGKISEITLREGGEGSFCLPRYQKPYRYESREKLTFERKGIKLQYGLASFFQINTSMISNLVDAVRKAVGTTRWDTLIDLYAGVGLFSLALRSQFKSVVGVESNRDSIFHFHRNVEANHSKNVRIVKGRVEDALEAVHESTKYQSRCIVLDPPREGLLKEVVEKLNEMKADQLIYVSCEPSTFARDLKGLGATYRLKSITPLDMFPQTAHFELVATFIKK